MFPMSGKKASEILGVHQRTLYNWEKKGRIEIIISKRGKRFYNVKKFLEENGIKYVNISNEIKCVNIKDLNNLEETNKNK